MPEQLDPDYCRREAKRLFAAADVEKNEVLRAELRKVAEHFDILAAEIEHVKALNGHGR